MSRHRLSDGLSDHHRPWTEVLNGQWYARCSCGGWSSNPERVKSGHDIKNRSEALKEHMTHLLDVRRYSRARFG
jgi:hypothetical protein